MNEVFLAFGRGVVKFLISCFVGTGVGLLTFGIAVKDNPYWYSAPAPPGGLFVGFGAGLLTTGGMMMALFFGPRVWKGPPAEAAKPAAPADWSR
jgi:hypothetical protein